MELDTYCKVMYQLSWLVSWTVTLNNMRRAGPFFVYSITSVVVCLLYLHYHIYLYVRLYFPEVGPCMEHSNGDER